MKIIDLDDMCVIKWRLTDVCNYNCSYCTAGSCTLCGHMSIYPKEPELDKINSLT